MFEQYIRFIKHKIIVINIYNQNKNVCIFPLGISVT